MSANDKQRQGCAASLATLGIVLLIVIAALAPIIANDRPIVAKVDGHVVFPALNTYMGERGLGPGGREWKQWWYELEDAGEDWAIMPLIPYGPFETDMNRINAGPIVGQHYLGNDDTGRDLLARVVHGASTALFVGLGSTLLALLIGVPLGAWAGLRGGVADTIVLRLVEMFLCFPAFFLVLAVLAFVPDATLGIVLVLGLLAWTSFARIVRGEFLSLREREFVICARSLGVSRLRVVWSHMLPCVRGQILVNAAFIAATAIIVESGLRFLGVGAALDTVSWGDMLQQGREYAYTGTWHLWLFPSLAIIFTVMCLHSLADRFRES